MRNISKHIKKHKWKIAFWTVAIKITIAFTILLVLQGCIPEPRACFGESCVDLELALTDDEMRTGLMEHDELPEGRGMLFVFEKSKQVSFWMKNVEFPIDIVWLDSDKRIVHIEKEVPPCPAEQKSCPSYSPNTDAKYVIELPAGFSNDNNLKIGDISEFVGVSY